MSRLAIAIGCRYGDNRLEKYNGGARRRSLPSSPGIHHVFLTRLNPQACQSHLQSRVRSWLSPPSWPARRRDRPVTGRVSTTGFSIRKYGGLPFYAFKPRATGTFEPLARGTQVRVQIRISLRPLFLLALTSWLLYFAFVLMTGYWRVLRAIGLHDVVMLNLVPAAITIPALLFWFLISLHRSRKEQQFLLDVVRTTLDAHAVTRKRDRGMLAA